MHNHRSIKLFILSFSLIIGLTLLKKEITGSPLSIIITSFCIGIIVPLISLWMLKVKEKQKSFLSQEVKVDFTHKNWNFSDSKKLLARTKALSIKANIPNPKIKIIDSPLEFAYAYQTYERRGIINISSKALERWNFKTLIGVIAHEMAHLKNRDSLKGFSRSALAIFSLTLIYFFAKNLVGIILPILLFIELYKIRTREYEADLQALSLTNSEHVLNYMMDAYLEQQEAVQKKTADTYFVLSKKGIKFLKEKIKSLISLFSYQAMVYAINHLSTHPSWPQRINKILEAQNIQLSNKELKFFIRRLAQSKNKKAKGHYIDFKKSVLSLDQINQLLK